MRLFDSDVFEVKVPALQNPDKIKAADPPRRASSEGRRYESKS